MRFTKTISFSISLLLIIIVVGLLAMLFYNNLYAMNVVRNQVVQSYRDLLPRYVEKQDDNLSDVQDHLIRSLNHNTEIPELKALGAAAPQSDAYHFARTACS
jgi:two-component system sensor histidine kinase YesM